MEYHLSHDERVNIKDCLEAEMETRKIEPELWNIVCVLDHLGYLSGAPTMRALDEFESCPKCHHPNKVGFTKCAWCKTTRQ